MPIEIISAEETWNKNQKENKQRRWPSRETTERIYPIAEPKTQSSFKIEADEKIFCIGSCFAAELGRALHRLNYRVLSVFHNLPKSANRSSTDEGMFHKYNVATIYNELSWALNPQTPYSHEQVLIETTGQRLQDYQLAGRRYADEPEIAKQFRIAFNQAFKTVQEADVVILTLGLSEAWFDKKTQLYLNTAIPAQLIKRYPNRFEVHILNYEETLYYLNGIYQLLSSSLKPNFRLLITVSPLPLSFTFRDQDILVANAYSKAVLRAAVEEFLIGKNNVNYFPSYEFVTLSNPDTVWTADDLRHVDSVFVDYIMANVMQQFTDAPAQHSILAKAKALYHRNFLVEAKQVLRPLIKDKANTPKEVWLLWTALQLGINSEKSSLLKIIEHFKTYRHLNPTQQISRLIKRYRKGKNYSYMGYIDSWQDSCIKGWAVHRKQQKSIQVNVLVNGQLMTTITANQARADVVDVYGTYLYCGFSITLSLNKTLQNKIQIVFADTGKELNGSPIYDF